MIREAAVAVYLLRREMVSEWYNPLLRTHSLLTSLTNILTPLPCDKKHGFIIVVVEDTEDTIWEMGVVMSDGEVFNVPIPGIPLDRLDERAMYRFSTGEGVEVYRAYKAGTPIVVIAVNKDGVYSIRDEEEEGKC